MGEQHKPSPFRLDSVGYDFFSLILINLFLISMPETLIWGDKGGLGEGGGEGVLLGFILGTEHPDLGCCFGSEGWGGVGGVGFKLDPMVPLGGPFGGPFAALYVAVSPKVWRRTAPNSPPPKKTPKPPQKRLFFGVGLRWFRWVFLPFSPRRCEERRPLLGPFGVLFLFRGGFYMGKRDRTAPNGTPGRRFAAVWCLFAPFFFGGDFGISRFWGHFAVLETNKKKTQ